jgi:SsrA-binding protein
MRKRKSIYNNRKAYFNFEIGKTYTAGLMLLGGEIKSIRAGEVSIKEAYCYFQKDGLYIKGMYIKPYTSRTTTSSSAEPTRLRKLLVNKEEQEKIRKAIDQKGATIVPLELFIGKNGKCKVEIGIAKGKKQHDKRNSIKDKDLKREASREE